MTQSQPKSQTTNGLERVLGPSAATAIVLGTMIGTGIFLKPSEVAYDAGSIGIVAAAWIVGGILSLFGGLCYAELGSSIPEAGGEYAYLRHGFGTTSAFLFGWMHSIVARPASAAAIAAGFMRFCSFFFPVIESPFYIIHLHIAFVGSHSLSLAFTWAQPLAVATLIVVTAINYVGVRLGGQVQIVLTVIKVGAVLTLIIGVSC